MTDGESARIVQRGEPSVRRSAGHRVAWWLVGFLVVFAMPSAGQDATSQIKSHIDRLQQSLKDKPVSDPNLPNVDSMIGDSLQAASEALSAGRQ